ncbi:MAG: hypothetical protein J6D47_16050 [Peptostreptococcaceae bacterium]|nr:hypothetical protein [Peptostreptococcaceae bacterium]
MNKIIEVNNGEQLSLEQTKSQFAKEKFLEITLKTINDSLNGVSSDISNNHKDIKAKYEELLRQNNKLVEMINEINAKDKQLNIETLKNKIDAIINIHNVKPTKKKEVGKLTRDILICSYKELSNEPSVDEMIKIENLINEQVLDIKKNNPKWFKEEDIETDNEIIKRLCNEIINIKSKLRDKDEYIKELKNTLKYKEENYKNAENRFNEELKLLKEEVYEFILEITSEGKS